MSFATVLERLQKLENPYPGLRPFETDESHLFFGRSQQIAELAARLERNRFVAVVGMSGSGKSSLVRAGLIPALTRYRLGEPATRWRTVVTRPAGRPFASLAEQLVQAGLEASGPPLQESSHGLIRVARQLATSERLLLVIDQFEELFRYKDVAPLGTDALRRRETAAAEAAEFVQLLLAACRHEPPVYVVLTMRSDYLGDCAEFRDLPETLNDCQYLVPRLTRQQRKEAIVGPLGRVKIDPTLVERVLNDAGDEPDELPVLEHALMRTWSHWRTSDPGQTRGIELQDYTAIGGFQNAVDDHAEELLKGSSTALAAVIFKRLTARGRGNRERRDPASLAELWAVCGAADRERQAAVTALVDALRRKEAAFLTPRDGRLDADSYIDITHESLIRQWRTLREVWLPEEQKSAKTFIDLIEKSRKWISQKGEPLRGLDLTDAEEWNRSRNPTAAWGRHYADDAALEDVLALLDASRAEEKTRARRAARNLWIAVGLALVFAGLAGVAARQWRLTRIAQQISLARQLAAQAQLMASEGQLDLTPAVLLATESMRRSPTLEGDRILRERTALLPRPVWSRSLQQRPAVVSFSPDGQRLITGAEDAIVVFDAAAGNEVSRVPHKERPWDMTLSGDGRLLAASFGDEVRVIDATTGSEIARIPQKRTSYYENTFSGNGQWLATESASGIRLSELTTGRDVLLADTRRISSVALSWDGRLVATAGEDGIKVLQVEGAGRNVHRVTDDESNGFLLFSRNGQWLAAGGVDGVVRVFETQTGKEIAHLSHSGPAVGVAFSADGRWLATGSDDGTARVFEMPRGREVCRLQQKGRPIALSQDGLWLATGGQDNTVRVFAVTRGNEIGRVDYHDDGEPVAFTPTRPWFAKGSSDNTVRVHDVVSGAEVARIPHEGPVGALTFSGDERWMATVSQNRVVRVFDSASWREVGKLPPRESVEAIALSTDGHWLATSSRDQTVQVFESGRWNEVARFTGRVATVLALSHDGRWLATGGSDDRAVVFDVASGKEAARLVHQMPVTRMAFSADGRRLATAHNGVVRLFKPGNWSEIVRIDHQGSGLELALSADGRWLATGTENPYAIRIFAAEDGREVGHVSAETPTAPIGYAQRWLIAAALSTTKSEIVFTRHLLSTQDVIDDACSRLSRNLTLDEWHRFAGAEVPYERTCRNLP